MTFLAADGTNSASANSYVTVEYADAYHALRNNGAWSLNNRGKSVKQAALVKATDFVDRVFRSQYLGLPVVPLGLQWPRYDTDNKFPIDSIPELLQKAVCELALQEVDIGLAPKLTRDPQLKRRKIDVLEKEWFEAAPGSQYVVSAAAKGYLSGITCSLRGGGINRRVVRV